MSPTREAHTSPPLESPSLLVGTLGQLEDFGRKLQDGPGGRGAATSHECIRVFHREDRLRNQPRGFIKVYPCDCVQQSG